MECDVPANQCIDIHCGGHGICLMGACICNTGYKGDNCEEGKVDYLFPCYIIYIFIYILDIWLLLIVNSETVS